MKNQPRHRNLFKNNLVFYSLLCFSHSLYFYFFVLCVISNHCPLQALLSAFFSNVRVQQEGFWEESIKDCRSLRIFLNMYTKLLKPPFSCIQGECHSLKLMYLFTDSMSSPFPFYYHPAGINCFLVFSMCKMWKAECNLLCFRLTKIALISCVPTTAAVTFCTPILAQREMNCLQGGKKLLSVCRR